MFTQFINIISAPNEAFKAIKEKPSIWLPLLAILIIAAGSQFIIFNSIDFDFFLESMIQQTAENQNIPESEARQQLSIMSPTLLSVSAAAGTLLVVPLIFAIYAAYLNLIAKLKDDALGFAHMFSLICWTSIPVIFTSLAALVSVLISSTGEFNEAQLNPLSLSSLLPLGDTALGPLFSRLDLPTIWSSVLLVLGYKFFTNSTGVKSSLVVLGPYILIYGVWAAFLIS